MIYELRKFKFILLLIFFLSSFLLWQNAQAACTGESPTWSSTADYDSVKTCVASASSGDTIQLSDGDATWDTPLIINKGLIFHGGAGTITVSGTQNDFAIRYEPSNPSLDEMFEMYGFTINGTFQIKVDNNSTSHVLTKIKIHDNNLTTGDTYVLRVVGMVYGVFYHNIITATGEAIDIVGGGNSAITLPVFASQYGNANSFFVEDNIFNAGDLVVYGSDAAKYVFRYNSLTMNTGNVRTMVDMHGTYTQFCNTMSAEVYGNNVTHNAALFFWNQRGGWNLGFYNYTSSTGTLYQRIRDDYYLSAYCGSEEWDTCNTCDDNIGLTQAIHPENSYWWNNRGGTGNLATINIDSINITENINFWAQRAGVFNGSGNTNNGGGVGCGILANRPTTCTTGVAYWATNQSCTDMTDMVGVNPATPISGTLYKCTATDTWTEYYEPYTYPHPLRTEAYDIIAPASPTGLSVN